MKMDEYTHGTLRFWREATATHDIKFAVGKLQVPGAVDRQRDVVAQRTVSKGRGDDAGHRIAVTLYSNPGITLVCYQSVSGI